MLLYFQVEKIIVATTTHLSMAEAWARPVARPVWVKAGHEARSSTNSLNSGTSLTSPHPQPTLSACHPIKLVQNCRSSSCHSMLVQALVAGHPLYPVGLHPSFPPSRDSPSLRHNSSNLAWPRHHLATSRGRSQRRNKTCRRRLTLLHPPHQQV